MKKYCYMLLLLAAMVLPTVLMAQTTVTVGTGTSNTSGYYVPFYTTKYAFVEVKYNGTNISQAGAEAGYIGAIAFDRYATTTTPALEVGDFTIWMGVSSTATFGSTTDWVPAEQMTMVAHYDNYVTSAGTGWMQIPLQVPFYYTPSDTTHLVIAFGRKSPGTLASTVQKFVYGTVSNSILYRSNATYDSVASYPQGNPTGTRSSNLPNIQLVMNSTPTFCFAPTGLSLVDRTSSTLSFKWDGGATTYQYAYAIGEETFDPTMANWHTTTDTMVTLTGLEEDTSYIFYVRKQCGTDYSDYNSLTASTTVVPTSLPFVCGFEENESDLDKWLLMNYSYPNKWIIDSAAHYGENSERALYISSDSGATSGYVHTATSVYAVRLLEMPVSGSYDISFDWIANGEGSADFLRAALVPATLELPSPSGTTAPSGLTGSATPTGWISLDGGAKMNLVTDWQHSAQTLNLPAGLYNLVFYWRNDGSLGTNTTVAIDNISISESACPGVDSVEIVAGDNYAYFTLYAFGSPSEYMFVYKNRSSVAYDTVFTYTDEVSLENIASGSYYDAWVYTICGSDTALSGYEFSFHTECGPIENLPWDYGFEGAVSMMHVTATGSASGSERWPYCWNCFNGGYATYYWVGNTSATYAHTGTNSWKYSGGNSATNHNDDWLVTPMLNLTGDDELTFWMRSSSNSTASTKYRARIQVWASNEDAVSQTDTANFVALPINDYGYQATNDSSTWKQYTVSLAGLYGYHWLAFVVKADSAYTAYLDDLRVYTRSNCPDAVNPHVASVGAYEATLAWSDTSATNPANSWDVYFGLAGFDADTVAYVNTDDTSYTFDYLMPQTDYEFFVVAYCADGSMANATPRVRFSTACAPIDSLPYVEDFENYGTGTSSPIDPCWTKYYSNGTTYPYPYSTAAVTGSRGLYFYSSATAYSYAALPLFVTSLDSLRVRFDMKRYNSTTTTYGTALYVGVMSDPNDISTFDTIALFNLYNLPGGTIQSNNEVLLDTYTGQGGYIAFLAPMTGSLNFTTNYAYLDNVIVDYIPNCRRVKDLAADNITANSAEISWYGTSDSYQIACIEGYEMIPSDAAMTIVADTILTLTGLQNYSGYTVMVRGICGNDTSEWCAPISFRTMIDCGANSLNIIDTIGDGTSSSYMYVAYCYSSYPRGTSTNIFTAEELNNMGLLSNNRINSLSLHIGSTGGTVDSMSIYMMETDLSEFSSTPANDTIPVANMTKVFSGTLNATANSWLEIPLDSTFFYSGTRNLAITFRRSVAPSASVTFYYTSTTPNYRSAYGYQSTTTTSLSATRTYYRPNIIFNVCTEVPACERPDITVGVVNPTDASLNWTSTASNYELAYSSESFLPDSTGSQTIVPLSTNSYTLTGLNPSTTYYVSVRALCQNDNSSWSVVSQFTTPCLPVSLPYTEDFESYGTGATQPIDPCWTKGTNNSTAYPYPYGTNVISGTRHLYFYTFKSSTTSYYCYAAMPLFDADIDTLMLSFKTKRYSTTTDAYTSCFVVGVMSDPSDISTFDTVQVFDLRNQPGGSVHGIEVMFDNYTGNGRYIAFLAPPIDPIGTVTSSYNYVYIDDITVDYIPSCFTPSNMSTPSATITEMDAELVWSGMANSYELAWAQEDAFDTAATHSLLTAADYTVDSLGNFHYLLQGLNHSTRYSWNVRAICSVGDTSAWPLTPVSFRTDCGVIDSFPWNADLDGTWYVYSGTTYPKFPMCWAAIDGGSTSYNWRNTTAASYLHSGTTAIQFYGTTTTTTEHNDYLITPELQLNGHQQITFWARGTTTSGSTYTGRFSLKYAPVDPTSSTISTSDFTQIGDRIEVLGASDYTQYTIPLMGLTGNYRLAFAVDTASYYINIDDVTVEDMPACPMPFNVNVPESSITATSADVAWDYYLGYDVMSWQIEYGYAGFTQGEGTIVNAASSPATITGLDFGHGYEVYVRPICSVTDTGVWSNAASFTSGCDMISTLPYSNDFEGEVTGGASITSYPQFVNCWTRINNASSASYEGYPYVYGTASYAYSGMKSLYFYRSGSTTYADEYAVLPQIDTTQLNVNELQLRFKARTSTTASAVAVSRMAVGVIRNLGNEATFTAVDTIRMTSAYQEFEVPLNTYTGDGSYIAMCMITPDTSSTSVYAYAYVDDVVLEEIPTCPRPNHLEFVEASPNSISVEWNNRSSAMLFEVAYTNTSNNTSASSFVSITNATISGLSPATAYQLKVRAICGEGDTSDWSEPIVAFTECMPISLETPYVQDFEAYEGAAYNVEGSLPVCWSGYYNGTTAGYYPHIVSGGGSYCYTHGENALVMTSSNSATYGNTKIVTLPEFVEPVNTTLLSFWMCSEGNGTSAVNGTLYVGYTTSDNLAESFVAIDSIPASTATVHSGNGVQAPGVGYYDTISFESVPDSAMRIAFMWYQNSTYYSVCIDDIVVSTTMNCFVPTDRNVATTATTATISWSNPGEFNVSYRQEGETDWSENQHITGATSVTLSNLAPATTYLYRMQKICESGDSSDYATGNFITDSMNCTVPTGLAVSNIQHDAVTLTWTAESTDAEYVAHVFSAHHDVYDTVSGATTTVTGLYAAEAYQVAIQRSCGFGYYSEWSDTLSFTTPTCQPVTNVTATAIDGTTNVTVAWTAAAGSDTWQIVYGYDGFGQGEGTTITVTTNPYVVTGLEEMTPYDFYVRTVCGEGWNSNWSNVAHATTDAPDVPCATVEGVTANVTDNSVAISWNAVENAQIYELEYGAAGFVLGTGTAVNNLSATNYTVNNLAAGNYEVYVRANCGETNYGPWSQAAQFAIVATCDPVTNVIATPLEGTTNVTVAWTAAPGTDTWQVEYGTAGFSHGNGIVITVTDNPTMITGLESETAYDFYVRTVCGEGLYSNWSDVAHATTDAPDVECGTVEGVAANVDGNYVVINWNAVENAESYELEYGTVGFSFGQGTSVDNLTALAYSITDMPNGNYEVYVRANCGDNNYGPWSQSVTFSVMVGINDAYGDMQLSLYPNPATNVTTISLSGFAGKVNVQVVDLNGRVAASETMECDGNCVKTMNVNNLAQGTYFVRVYGDTVNMVRKLVVR